MLTVYPKLIKRIRDALQEIEAQRQKSNKKYNSSRTRAASIEERPLRWNFFRGFYREGPKRPSFTERLSTLNDAWEADLSNSIIASLISITAADLDEERDALQRVESWTKYDVDLRLRKLQRLEDQAMRIRQKLNPSPKDDQEKIIYGLKDIFTPPTFKQMLGKLDCADEIKDAIWELEQFKKSRPQKQWPGEKPQDQPQTVKERLRQNTKSITEFLQAQEENIQDLIKQGFTPQKAKEIVDEAVRELRREGRL
jgi:hypothetical protein